MSTCKDAHKSYRSLYKKTRMAWIETHKEIRDCLEFMGNSLTAPRVRKNDNNYNNQTGVVKKDALGNEAETWKTQVAISVE